MDEIVRWRANSSKINEQLWTKYAADVKSIGKCTDSELDKLFDLLDSSFLSAENALSDAISSLDRIGGRRSRRMRYLIIWLRGRISSYMNSFHLNVVLSNHLFSTKGCGNDDRNCTVEAKHKFLKQYKDLLRRHVSHNSWNPWWTVRTLNQIMETLNVLNEKLNKLEFVLNKHQRSIRLLKSDIEKMIIPLQGRLKKIIAKRARRRKVQRLN